MHDEASQTNLDKEVERITRILGMESAGDLLRWAPRSYLDYREAKENIEHLEGRGMTLMAVTVEARKEYSRDGAPISAWSDERPFRLAMRCRDGAGLSIWMTVFGNLNEWKNVRVGQRVNVFGEVERWNDSLQIKNPSLVHESKVGGMFPVYRGKRGRVAADAITACIQDLMARNPQSGVDAIERMFAKDAAAIAQETRLRFPDVLSLVKALHTPAAPPEAFHALSEAKALSIHYLREQASRLKKRRPDPLSAIPVKGSDILALIQAFPCELTQDQSSAITEIMMDLASDIPMRRLLSGDVGTGKTLTYLTPAVAALRKGAIVMILTPNTLLAEQLVKEVAHFYPGTPTCLIAGKTRKKPNAGELMIGTTALITAVKKAKLVPNFLICDEQQRLSTQQREALLGPETNLLDATATAIPRTVALATHGGLSVSILRESPVEKNISTEVVGIADRKRVFEELSGIVGAGSKIAIVYPRLESEDEGRVVSIDRAYAHWSRLFPGQVVVLHGKLGDDEKKQAIERINAGNASIIIGSTVMEVGLNIIGLRGMMINEADRYGVSQLHQLRGRLARQGGEGKMFLYLPKDETEYVNSTLKRVRMIASTTDGFYLSEQDAYMRGFGDLSEEGETQDGAMEMLFHGIKITPNDLLG